MDPFAGKIMFRDIMYSTEDFTLRIQDGWLVFRWWRSYVPKDISEGKTVKIISIKHTNRFSFTDLSHSDTRLSLLWNGFELHIFNRSHLYNELERIFNLPPPEENFKNSPEKQAPSQTKSDETNGWGSRILGRSWRDLIPVIKVEICNVSLP